jgi:hypothetical protein
MKIRSFIALGLLFLAGVGHAATDRGFATIEGTIIDETRFGGCMALISEMPAGVSCPNNWVTFSCTGDFNSSSVGWKKFENSQIALLTNNRVRVYVDDARTHNGNCYVSRMDMIP